MLYQELIDAEAAVFIGAAAFEPMLAQTRQRDGIGSRTLTSTTGDPEAAARNVLPVTAGTAPPGRSSTVDSRDEGARARCLDP